MKLTRAQAVKSIAFTALGAAPGAIWFYCAGTTQSLVIACLAAAVGFGLSLPGVSARRVAGGTIGMIAMRNLPGSVGRKVFEKLTADEDTGERTENQKQADARWGD